MNDLTKRLVSPVTIYPLVVVAFAIAFLFYWIPATQRKKLAHDRQALQELTFAADRVGIELTNLGNGLEAYLGLHYTKPPFKPESASEVLLHRTQSDLTDERIRDYLRDQLPLLEWPLSCTITGILAPGRMRLGMRTHASGEQILFHWTENNDPHCAILRVREATQRTLSSIPQGLFHEIVLATADGRVLTSTERSAIRLVRLPRSAAKASGKPGGSSKAAARKSDKSSEKKVESSGESENPAKDRKTDSSEEDRDNFGASRLTEVEIAEEPYTMYSVPVKLPFEWEQSGGDSGLIVAGLIRSSTRESRSMAPSRGPMLAFVIVFAALIFGSWPLLKVGSLRPSDPIQRREMAHYIVSSQIALCILTVGCIQLGYNFDAGTGGDFLDKLGIKIKENTSREVVRALRTLDRIESSPEFGHTNADKAKPCFRLPGSSSKQNENIECKSNIYDDRGLYLFEYPYFRQIFWGDANGDQKRKWTTDQFVTPSTPSRFRPLYEQTRIGNLWSITDPRGVENSNFRIDPLYSPNTAEYVAVISRRYAMPEHKELFSSHIVTPMLSLINPVLPADYRFAVIDETGRILFSSEVDKNGHENFLDQCTQCEGVRQAMYAHEPFLHRIRYHGEEFLATATPFDVFKGCPWTLIVMEDYEPRRAHWNEMTSLLGILLAAHLLFCAILAYSIPGPLRYPPAWLWPSAKKTNDYFQICVALLCSLGCAGWAIFRSGRFFTFFPLAGLPFVVCLCVWFKLLNTPGSKSNPGERSIASPRILWLVLAYGAVTSVYLLIATSDEPFAGESVGRFLLPFLLSLGCLLYLEAPAPVVSQRIVAWVGWSGWFSVLVLFVLMHTAILPTLHMFRVAYDIEATVSARRRLVRSAAELDAREARIQAGSLSAFAPDQDEDPNNAKHRDRDKNRLRFIDRRLHQERLDRYDAATTYASPLHFVPAMVPVDHPAECLTDSTFSCSKGCETPCQGAAKRETASQHDSGSHGGKDRGAVPRFVNLEGRMLLSLLQFIESPLEPLTRLGSGNARWEFVSQGHHSVAISSRVPSNGTTLSGNPTQILVDQPRTFRFSDYSRKWPVFLVWTVAALAFLRFVVYRAIRDFTKTLFMIDRPRSSGPAIPYPAETLVQAIRRGDVWMGLHDGSEAFERQLRDLAAQRQLVRWEWGKFDVKGWKSRVFANLPVVVEGCTESPSPHDPAGDAAKMAFLQEAARSGLAIGFLATRHPAFWRAAESEKDPIWAVDLEDEAACKWRQSLFGIQVLALKGVKDDPFSVWRASTTQEKIALDNLARYGWVNFKNAEAVDHLIRRGIVVAKPVPRFASRDFARFVRTTVTAHDREGWVGKEETSSWEGFKSAAPVAISLVSAMFLYLSELPVFGAAIATAGPLVPLLRHLFTPTASQPGSRT